MEFKTIFVNHRKKLKLTQSSLAKRLHVSDKTISKWETGSSVPDLSMLKAIAAELDVPVSELLSADEWKIETAPNQARDRSRSDRYLKNQIIATLLFVCPVLGMILGFIIRTPFGALFYSIVPYTSILSLGLFIYHAFTFHNDYTLKPSREKEDRIFVLTIRFYSFSVVLLLSLFSILIQSMNGTTIVFGMISLYPILVAFNVIVAKKNGFVVVKDRTNQGLIIVFCLLIGVYLFLQMLIFQLDFFSDLGIDVFTWVDQILRYKIIYEIGPIVIAFLITQRMEYRIPAER